MTSELQKTARCLYDVFLMFVSVPFAVLDEWRVWINR